MSSDKQTSSSTSNLVEGGRPASPVAAGLRQRGVQRAFTFNDPPTNTVRRRSSFLSDTFSETHKSFRSSTDDLLLPRVKAVTSSENEAAAETTHWHSLPLGLALLPALAGIFFKDGSAIITDITLLGLAAIFLNWALRLPWEWYRSAQATCLEESDLPSSFQPIIEDDEGGGTDPDMPARDHGPDPKIIGQEATTISEELTSARQELRFHEISALLACFASPLAGAWLLHAIRNQLSRPSEGLVSNYNLTIFLLVAELRPLSHLMKMIQRRTLFLQRRVTAGNTQFRSDDDVHVIADLTTRLGELEAHIADQTTGPAPIGTTSPEVGDAFLAKVLTQTNADVRKSIHPELDALNRAMRRYEKRMTISAIQVEARLQDVETRLKDVVALAAAAQRNADGSSHTFFMTLVNWLSALIVIPVQLAVDALKFPGRCVQLGFSWLQRALRISKVTQDHRNGRLSSKQGAVPRPRPVLKKVKATS